MLSPCRTAEAKSDASPLPAQCGQGQAPPLLTSAPPWRAPLLIRKPTNHPERLAVPANSGDRSGRRRGRLNLSPNRKVKTSVAGCGAVPANPGTRSARRRGHRRVWPNRKIKTESPLRLDEYGSGVAVAGVAPRRRSSPASCTAATSVFPRPPSRLQSPVGAAFRGRTVGRFTPAPVRPAGAPALPLGRRDSPSALLRTRHVSFSHPRPRNRLRGFQGAGRPLPPVETVRSGADFQWKILHLSSPAQKKVQFAVIKNSL